jgi:hypothetical protein
MKKSMLTILLALSLQQVAGQGSGYCVEFNGTNDFIDCGAIPLGTADFSFEAWTYLFQSSSTQPVGIIGNWVSGGATPYFYAIYNYPGAGQISLIFHNGNNVNQYATWNMNPNNTWVHIAGVYDRDGFMQLYVNGEVKATKDISASAFASLSSISNRLQIGCAGSAPASGYPWNGYMDEVRLWNKALTMSEIRLNMCSKLTGTESGLIGYWRFDEPSGATAIDSSPFARNGTLY